LLELLPRRPQSTAQAGKFSAVSLSVPPENSEQFRWFAEQVQPHEPMLRAWLRAQFPREGDVDDVVQEALVRVLQAHATQTIESPKAFLFATARNVALGRLRHEKVAGNFALAEKELSGILDERANVAHEVARAQELEMLTQAIQSLPTRCRQIITLRRIYGLSQKEVAAELGIAEHTVEAQGTIGLRKLTEYFERFERRRPTAHE
jgi:RNA polymerase sigma-70 factor (ECF subfamily)